MPRVRRRRSPARSDDTAMLRRSAEQLPCVTTVHLPGTGRGARFRRLMKAADVQVLAAGRARVLAPERLEPLMRAGNAASPAPARNS